MFAMKTHASAETAVRSKPFAGLRHRPSQANVRSAIHLRGRSWKPMALSERLMISSVNLPIFCSALRDGATAAGKRKGGCEQAASFASPR